MQRIPTATWVLIADGTEARLLANVGTAVDVSLKQERMLGPSNLDDDGPSGHRPPESDGQSTDEATFAKQLARWLNAAALNDEFEHLVLMADPQTLGQIRPQLHAETRRRLIREVAKTMTKSPLQDIEKALV